MPPRKTNLIFILTAVVLVAVLRFYFDISWFLSILAIFVGWPMIGNIITIDDDLKGGWSNPDGKARPEILTGAFWAKISAGIACAFAGAGIDLGIGTPQSASAWMASAGFTFFSIGLLSKPFRPLWFILTLLLSVAAILSIANF